MKRVLEISMNIGLAAFLVPSVPLVIAYFALLFQKITEPHQKNMNGNEVIQFGLIAVLLAIVDFFIIRRFVKVVRKSNDRQQNA